MSDVLLSQTYLLCPRPPHLGSLSPRSLRSIIILLKRPNMHPCIFTTCGYGTQRTHPDYARSAAWSSSLRASAPAILSLQLFKSLMDTGTYLCRTGADGDEHHFIFTRPPLDPVRQRSNQLFAVVPRAARGSQLLRSCLLCH